VPPAAKVRPRLVVGLPTYDGRRYNGKAMSEILGISNLDVRCIEIQNSLLALAFNQAWAAALNDNATFFLMLHEDIIPVTDQWVAVMFRELMDRRADVISVVSPIKTPDGLTSTAVETDDPWNPRRLTMTEVYERPETWTEEGLLLNTGLMLVDFRAPWVNDAYFTINDRIIRKPTGEYMAEVQPEDWNISRTARAAGAKLYATRKVTVLHVGRAGYDNSCPWGDKKIDPVYAEKYGAAPQGVSQTNE
jgi:hypothetical protein